MSVLANDNDLLSGLFAAMWELTMLLVEAMVWGIAMVVYLVAKVFGRSVSKPDWKRTRRLSGQVGFQAKALGMMVILLGVAGWYGVQSIIFREVTVQASDGVKVPFGTFVLQSSSGPKALKTDYGGNLRLPRFGWTNLSLTDLRYVPTNWSASNLPKAIVVDRSSAAEAVDRAAAGFLKDVISMKSAPPGQGANTGRSRGERTDRVEGTSRSRLTSGR